MQTIGNTLGVANADRRMGTRGQLQNGGEFNNDSFAWVHKSHNAKGSRTATHHKNKWSLWATKVKTEKRTAATKERDSGHGALDQKECDTYNLRMGDLLGACWQDQSIDLRE